MSCTDPYKLQRFLDAQDGVYEGVLAELRAGQKRSHWMWFIFPQLKSLGSSSMAKLYGIASRQEAAVYLQHPVLGPRLRECAGLVNAIEGRPIESIFGYPDNPKFRSSMTLFALVADDDAVFVAALKKYFSGEHDCITVQRIGF